MNKTSYLIFYLVNPFIALLRALRNVNKTSLHFVMMFFCAFYGSSQMIGEEGKRYKDASVYRDNFYEIHDNGLSWANFKNTLLDGETTFDVVVPLITFFTASITRNAKIFFFVMGLIFGFFYGKNIEFIIQNLPTEKYNKFLQFLFLVFALVVPFWSGLNGLRMWTGAHVFFYGVSRFLKDYNISYLSYIVLAVLFHFSFIIVVAIFFTFFFTPLKRYNTVYFGLFLITFVIANSNLELITELVRQYTPAIFQSKTDEYTKDVYVETFKENFMEGRSWHAIYFNTFLNYSLVYLLIITYFFNLKEKLLNANQSIYLSFSLLMFTFANLISTLPSGARFYSVAFLFSLIPITYCYVRTKNQRMFHFAFFPLLFWLVVNIRDGFDQITLATFLANPLLIWFDVLNQVPMIDYIK